MISHVLETKATRWDSWTEGGGWARALLVGEEGREGPATWHGVGELKAELSTSLP